MDQHTTPRPETDCVDESCRYGKRNLYYRRKAMTAGDMALEQRYLIERRRLLSRGIVGWGIACGFELSLQPGPKPDDPPQLVCGRGLALDRAGRELLRVDGGAVRECDLLILDNGLREASETAREKPTETEFRCLLTIRYAERPIDKVRVNGDCGCGESEWNHVCETVVFGLEPICGEDPCPAGEPRCRECHCRTGESRHAPDHHARQHRDRSACLCEWQTEHTIQTECAALAHCGDLMVALGDPVTLACVTIRFDRCGCPVLRCIDDACEPRRWIKTNDSLYDLIRGCDLTCIEHLSWGDWHRRAEPVPWTEFRDKFPRPPRHEYESDEERPRHLRSHFTIEFSGPVLSETLTPECIVFTIFSPDELAGMLHARRVRIPELELHARHDDDPEGTTRAVTLMFDSRWVDDQVWDSTTVFRHPHTRVEIEIRGDSILDCHGQALDGEAIGRHPAPSGNGSPGGTNLTTFRVEPRSHHAR